MANYSQGYFLVTYGVELSIDVTPNAATRKWAILGDGITNIAEALNEVKQQMFYLINKGFGQTEVTGMHPAYTVTGHRLKGDEAQDFLFSKKYKMGQERKTTLNVKVLNASDNSVIYDSYQVSVTFCDLQEYSGSTENGSDISITLEFNGAPEQLVAKPRVCVIGNGSEAVRLEVKNTASGVVVHYTKDGSEPTATSPAVSGVIVDEDNGTRTYKFKGFKEGCVPSETAEETITVVALPTLEPPVISKEGDNTPSVTVEMTPGEPVEGARIMYRTDDEPLTTWHEYSVPLVNTQVGVHTYSAKYILEMATGVIESDTATATITVTSE